MFFELRVDESTPSLREERSQWHSFSILLVIWLCCLAGCATNRPGAPERLSIEPTSISNTTVSQSNHTPHQNSPHPGPARAVVETVSFDDSEALPVDDHPGDLGEIANPEEPEEIPRGLVSSGEGVTAVQLDDVVASVHSSFPLLEVAYRESDIAAGKRLSAWGAFDTKLKAASENGPIGFYETYRHSAGFNTPVYGGGEVFGGYRVGRGVFQPWYLERQTNEGGEFKAGLRVPLWRDRRIDERRATLWRANYEFERVQPVIRAQLVMFVRDASIAYWEWLAAGQQYEIGKRALQLAEDRNDKIARQVQLGNLDPPEQKDNERLIAKREAKLIDLERKVQQSAIKLSLFYRAEDGAPLIPSEDRLHNFDDPPHVEDGVLELALETALAQRPELGVLAAESRKVQVDIAEAQNALRPSVAAHLVGSQDMGEPTSSKRDKSPFELEAGILVDIPLQRRKAQGKLRAASAKLDQLSSKRRFTEDKISTEVRAAHTALVAAFNRIEKVREAQRLAEYMAEVERSKLFAGQSDTLKVVLREQYAIEAAADVVLALFDYYAARTDFFAAQAIDWPIQVSQ